MQLHKLLDTLDPPLLRGVDREVRKQIIDVSHQKRFHAGDILLHQGEPCHYLALILSGHLLTLRQNPNGEETIFRLLNPGQTCMEAIMFIEGTSPISVRANSDTTILAIPRHLVESLSQNHPAFSYNLLKIVSNFYRVAMLQIDAITIKTAKDRVGYYLLNRYIDEHNAKSFELSFKKSDIARHLGITPETLSRSLSMLKDDNLRIQGEQVHLRNPFALCGFCDSDAHALCEKRRDPNCAQLKAKPISRPSK